MFWPVSFVVVALSFTCAFGVQPDDSAPPEPGSEGFDWMQHVNGEWLKGELKDVQDEDFEFESDEFDTHKLDINDIYRFVSNGEMRVGFYDGTEVVGRVRIEGDKVHVVTSEGIETYEKSNVRSIVTGRSIGGAYWSGKLSFGTEFLRGNVDQTDVSTYIRIGRRTVTTRAVLEFTGAFSEVNGETTEDNQRFLGRYDIYKDARVFFRVPELEVYRDQFQNIEIRVTPTVSAGYTLIDRGDLEGHATIGSGLRYTQFRDVQPGEESDDTQYVFIYGTDVEWEATPRIDVGASFSLTMPVPEADDYTFRTVAYTEIDLWKDFDLDVRFTWDRVNSPAANADGSTPEEDEYRLYVGIGYEF